MSATSIISLTENIKKADEQTKLMMKMDIHVTDFTDKSNYVNAVIHG